MFLKKIVSISRIFKKRFLLFAFNLSLTIALVGIKNLHAKPEHGWSDLQELVLAEEGEALLEVHLLDGLEPEELVLLGLADVGEVLLLGGVDLHVLGPGADTDDHARVDLGAGADEEGAPGLDVSEGVSGGDAVGHADDDAAALQVDGPAVGLVADEGVIQDGGAVGEDVELGVQAHDPAGGGAVDETGLAVGGAHGLQLGPAQGPLLDQLVLVLV